MKLSIHISDAEIRESIGRGMSANRRLSLADWVFRDLVQKADTVFRSQKCGWAVADLLRPVVREHYGPNHGNGG